MFRFIRQLLLSALALMMIWAIGFLWFTWQISAYETVIHQPVDAVVVLTGGAGRIDHGLKRIKEKQAKQIFISGVNDQATAEHIILQAIDRNASSVELKDSNQLALGHEATSTIGNAEEVKQWIEKHHIQSILLVTANYHMKRSLMEFRFVMPKNLEIIADPVQPEGFNISEWWRMGNSSRLILSEYHKLIAAYLRHMLIQWHTS